MLRSYITSYGTSIFDDKDINYYSVETDINYKILEGELLTEKWSESESERAM